MTNNVNHRGKSIIYEKAEFWTGALDAVAGTAGGTDITTDTTFANIFSRIRETQHIKIVTSATVYLTFNNTAGEEGAVLTLESGDTFDVDFAVRQISYSTNAGTPTIKIYLYE